VKPDDERIRIPFCGRKATPQDFLGDCGTHSTIAANFPRTNDRGHGAAQVNRRGGVMRESFEIEMPDTAPYKEWLGMVGSMALAVLVGAILYSAGVWS
jgi:hypothetical protein